MSCDAQGFHLGLDSRQIDQLWGVILLTFFNHLDRLSQKSIFVGVLELLAVDIHLASKRRGKYPTSSLASRDSVARLRQADLKTTYNVVGASLPSGVKFVV